MVDLHAVTGSGAETTISEESVGDFRNNLGGTLLTAQDEGYEQARLVWNGNIDRRPALIARCSGAADVIESVNFARNNNLLLSVRGGAHSAAGHATCDGGLVIDLTPMKGIQVDPVGRTARAQGGVVWSELDHEAQAFGLAAPGGVVSNTGIAGLTLGGGLGWLMGKHGLSCDNLISMDVVTADGRFLTASADENAELFWGLRGGGGNFGVVTSFEYQLHQIGPIVLGGMVIHPMDKAKEMLRFYRDFARGLPDEAEAFVAMLTSPEGDPIATMLLGYNGPIEEGERILAPAREFGPPIADLVSPMPYTVRQTLIDDLAVHGLQRYWKSGYMPELSDELIDLIVDRATPLISPMSAIALFYVHGAATRVNPSDTAVGLRNSQWDFDIISQWEDPSENDKQFQWTRDFWAAVEPFATGGVYVNHIAGDEPERVAAAYGGANYEQLVDVKNQYDPTNLFRLNHNIKPTV